MCGLNIINENLVKCCEGEYNNNDNRKFEIMELLAEVQDKNNILAINNGLLLDKIKTLETDKDIAINAKQTKPHSFGSQSAPSHSKVATSVDGKILTPVSNTGKLISRKQVAHQQKQNSIPTETSVADDNHGGEDNKELGESQNKHE
ncbi:hypothetical protein JTB14_011577 [Gonioctena quinquepunctata]|nr:hypothetical protein JTB14_011577 [Gonioctena quinquepunctata]